MRSRDPHQQTSVSRPTRGQAEVVAIVLLLGLIAIAAISVLVVGQAAISSTQEDAELEQVEQSFIQLSHEMARATVDGEMTNQIDLDVGETGAISKTDAGSITIEANGIGENNKTTIDFGAIEYKHDDGSVVAYQAGGVWSERGNETRMLSSPPIHYDVRTQTLGIPITDMSEDRDLNSGPIELGLDEVDSYSDITIAEDDSVNLTITSPYYRGWEQFFRQTAGDGSINSVEHGEGDEGTIEVSLGFHELSTAVENGASLYDDDAPHDPQDRIDDPSTGVQLPPMDDVIDDMIEEANESGENIEGSNEVHGPGLYYVDAIGPGDEYEFNVSEGDVTFVVENDVILEDGKIEVVDGDDTDNVLRIYAGGDLFELDGTIRPVNYEDDASVIQFYGPSTMGVNVGPSNSGEFIGLLYIASYGDNWPIEAPQCNNNPQMVYQAGGDMNFHGAAVAYSICAQANAGDNFTYDDNLDPESFNPFPDDYEHPPPITYLNIAVFDINVDNQ